MLASINNLTLFAAAAGHEEDEGGSFLVSPDVGLMIWTLVVFGLSMFVLAKFAFPRIQEALDKRQRVIEDSIETAERIRKEADEVLAEYRQRLTEARAQADEIVVKARKTAETQEARTIAAANAKREEMMEQARNDIQAETRAALNQIRAEVADLTILATEKVTRKSLTAKDQQRLVEEALGELDFATLAGEPEQNRN